MTEPPVPTVPPDKHPAKRTGGSASSRPEVQIGQLLGAGLQFATTIVLCAFGGWWLDERLGASPWLLILGCIFGSVAAFYHLYRSLVGPPVDDDHLNES